MNTILQCGDIHPQPGPHTSKSNTNEGKAVRLAKSTKYATIAHLLRMFMGPITDHFRRITSRELKHARF